MFKFCKHQLWECSRTLSDVAMGRRPADTVIRGARLVNVCTHEILDHTDVAIACGRIALVGDAAHCIGPETEVIEAGGQLLAPGFLDGHIHIESSMLTPVEYARAVLPHGTTGIYYDPHEICNVLGLKGVDLMAAAAAKTAVEAHVTAQTETESEVQYKPEDLPKLKDAVIRQAGNTVVLVVAAGVAGLCVRAAKGGLRK